MVRIIKNVEHGDIRYMNYSSVNNNAQIEEQDIVGLYGQNGSGKTAVVESLNILKCILSGVEIPYRVYEGLLSPDNKTILNDMTVNFESKHMKAFQDTVLTTGFQNLAVYCAQKRLSIFFNGLMLDKLAKDNDKFKLLR